MLARRTLASARPSGHVLARSGPLLSRRLATTLTGDVEFDVQGDPTAPLSTRPWPLHSKEEIKRHLTDVALRVGREAEARLEQGTPLIRDTYTLIPFNAAEVEKEISTVDQPKVQATQEKASDTKEHEFITDFLASRMAALMDEPSFSLYYGKPQPFIQLKKDWQKKVLSNLKTTVAAQQKKLLDDFIHSYKAFQKAIEDSKKARSELVQELKHSAEVQNNKELYVKTLAEKDNVELTGKEQDVLFALISDSLPARLARVIEERRPTEDALLQAAEPLFKDLASPTVQ